MASNITDKNLEEYLGGRLSPAVNRRIEKALSVSEELRQRFDEMKKEAELLDAVKASQSIRLPEHDEDQIIARGIESLTTELNGSNDRERSI